MQNGVVSDNFGFMLYERDKFGNVVEATYKYVCFIVDNGYFVWYCTIIPTKDAST